MATPRNRPGIARARRAGGIPFRRGVRPIPLGARPVHRALHQRLKVPRGVRLLAFEKTKKGIVVHFTKNGEKNDRVLTPAEVKHINREIAHLKTLPAFKNLRKNTGMVDKLTSVATNPQVITLVTHLLHL